MDYRIIVKSLSSVEIRLGYMQPQDMYVEPVA